MKLVENVEQIFENIMRLEEALEGSSAIADRLGLAHAWYIDARETRTKFGFSKFIGYQGITPEHYLAQYADLDGRNTEWVLSGFCEELTLGTPQFNHYHAELEAWLLKFGKKPRKKVRLMLLSAPEEASATLSEDRRLLDLLLHVADLLPVNQRHELRAKL